MLSTIKEGIFKLYNRFKTWKPIHLCWWFRKHNLPIPPYLIGASVDQNHWIIGDDDNADPDLCTWGSEDVARTNVSVLSKLMLRFQIQGSAFSSSDIELHFNTVDDPATATQATTGSDPVFIAGGTPLNLTSTTTNVMTPPASTWVDGAYMESWTSPTVSLDSQYTEIQFCIGFDGLACGETFYFWLKYDNGTALTSYNSPTCSISLETCKPRVAVTWAEFSTPGVPHLTINSNIVALGITNSFTADAFLGFPPIYGDITADAAICWTETPNWVSPEPDASVNTLPTLVFQMPNAVGNMHFHIQLDTVNTFDSINLKEYKSNENQTNWEYWDGTQWQAFPSTGVPPIYAGNECRLTLPDPLSETIW